VVKQAIQIIRRCSVTSLQIPNSRLGHKPQQSCFQVYC